MNKDIKSQVKKNRSSDTQNHISSSMLICIDVLSFFISLMPSVAALSFTGLLIARGYASTWLVLPLAPLVLFSSFIAIIFLIRICLPRLKSGRYKRELSKPVFAWFCHFALSRAAKITGLSSILQSFNVTKFLYWRALGAKVSFQIMSSYDVNFVDCQLITIGKNVTLGAQVSISCHSDVGSLLLLSPVVIEDNVFIGMSTVLGPGTIAKKGAWIGFGNSFVNRVIKENDKIKSKITEV